MLQEKLQIVKQRFDEVSDLIIQPDIIADQKRYIALNREYKDLNALMEKRAEFLSLSSNKKEAEAIISEEKDPEMLAMAKEELDVSSKKLVNTVTIGIATKIDTNKELKNQKLIFFKYIFTLLFK